MPAQPRRAHLRAAAWAAVLAGGAVLPACSDRAGSQTAPLETREASFSEQVQAVRSGQSDQIRLDRTSVGDEALGELDGLEDKLLRINLSHTTISDAGLKQIANMRKLSQLRLASERVTDAGLPCLTELKELRHLHLIDLPISDAGLEHLHGLTALESLYLDGTQVTDEGMSRLVEALPGVHVHFDGGHHRVDTAADDHGQ